jgi:hypothetical protein
MRYAIVDPSPDIVWVRPGVCVRVVAGIRHDWLEQIAAMPLDIARFPYRTEREVKVTATILRVHRPACLSPIE